MSTPQTSAPAGFPRPGAVPYLTVSGASEALTWYSKVFDAKILGTPITMEDGRIGHAELAIGEGVIYVAEEFPEMGLTAPRTGTASVSLMIPVDDPDLVLTHAREAGGRVERWTYESHGQRNASLIDPFGHRWLLAAPLGGVLHQGDIAAFTLCCPDADIAARFYGAVLGWDTTTDGNGFTVENATVPIRIEGGHHRTVLRCAYAVPDVEAARQRVLDAGGAVEATVCHTYDGISFELVGTDSAQRRPSINGEGPGDPAYITLECDDPDRARAFYEQVVGWTFDGSEDRGGYEMPGVHPMTGLTRAATTTITPMWRVEDAIAAADVVTSNGGEILAGPEAREYGVAAHCRDPQGGRFYLGS
ncbi:VOC family protein [Lolliginicoccus suaedae]|uniref:VOC family protein n=1 Tax=Lolliginicoccus suaedae TaxID=2605429 RepID=UPI0011F03C01|nr:VOC family protein [Lolliginicoccus suaedae]